MVSIFFVVEKKNCIIISVDISRMSSDYIFFFRLRCVLARFSYSFSNDMHICTESYSSFDFSFPSLKKKNTHTQYINT